MKKALTSLLLLLGIIGFAQTSSTTSTTTNTAATKYAKYCATWNLAQTEVFNEVHKPTDAQAHDQLVITKDGKYKLTYEGKSEEGTWTADAVNITLTSVDGVIKKFKVVECTATTLKVDYRDETEIHNILYYSNATSSSTAR